LIYIKKTPQLLFYPPLEKRSAKQRAKVLLSFLHLWTFKTPTKWAVMSDKDDADWALSVPNGVKREWKWILLRFL
jgi:hypothetical protein